MHTGRVGDADGLVVVGAGVVSLTVVCVVVDTNDGELVGNRVGGLVDGGPWVGGNTGGPVKVGGVEVGDDDGGVGAAWRRGRFELPPMQQHNKSKIWLLAIWRGDIDDLE